MFGFLRRKKPVEPVKPPQAETLPAAAPLHQPTEAGHPGPTTTAAAGVNTALPASPAAAPREPVAAAPVSSAAESAVPVAAVPTPAVPTPAVPTPAVPTPAVPTPAVPTPAVPIPVVPVPAPPEAAEPAPRKSWIAKLKQGLTKTRTNLAGMFGLIKIDEQLYEDLETALLTSDAGFDATQRILTQLRTSVNEQRLTDGQQVKRALREILAGHLKVLEAPIDIDRASPLVLMIAGVNGAGKTTSIGKLTHHLQREGKSILLAAGDTFRAAAREQLATWGERNDVQVIAQHGGDPGAVAFDAVTAGSARGTGVVLIDTAGRLPTPNQSDGGAEEDQALDRQGYAHGAA